MVILLEFCAGNLLHFSPIITREFQPDGDKVTDRLPDGLADESNDVWMERNFSRCWTFRKFHPAILLGIFTMNLGDGWTDGTDNGHKPSMTQGMHCIGCLP